MQHVKKISRRTRAVTGGTLVAAVALGGYGAYSASASSAVPVDRAARAALDAARKDDRRVSVAVVDRDGNTVVTLRGDGAGPQSYASAEKKAYTAVSWNAPTSELAKRLEQAPNLKDIPGTLFLAGGAPVTVKNAPIAGIGVAGAPSGDLDEKYARAGVAAITR